MALTPQTIDFLAENCLQDSKEWFHEHKADFERLVKQPMLELATKMAPGMEAIDPQLVTQPGKTISRVWRDTRFSKDKTIFRDVMWVVHHRGKGMALPTFFFEFSPRGYRYGCGYYQTPVPVKRRAEEMILADDRLYLEAQAALDKLQDMPLLGDFYKRRRFPDADPVKANWLERKDLDACHDGKDPDFLFSENLADLLVDKFAQLKPFYFFLLEAHTRAEGELPHRYARD